MNAPKIPPTNNDRHPKWLGDYIVRAQETFPPTEESRLIGRQGTLASLILLLYVGWSLLPFLFLSALLLHIGSPAAIACASLIMLIWVWVWISYAFRWLKNFQDPKDLIAITREDSPQLFAIVDEVCGRLGNETVDKVIVGGEGGGWAVLGRYRSWLHRDRKKYIKLGLLLFCYLDIDELKTVIAHEAHHLFRDNRRNETYSYFCSGLAWTAGWHWYWIPVRGIIRELNRRVTAMQIVRAKYKELAADEFQAKTCCPKACASALLKAYAIWEAVDWQSLGLNKKKFAPNTSFPEDIVALKMDSLEAAIENRKLLADQMQKKLKGIVAVDAIHAPLRDRLIAYLGSSSDSQIDAVIDSVASNLSVDRENTTRLMGTGADRIRDQLNVSGREKWHKYWKEKQEFYNRVQERLVPVEDIATANEALDHYYATESTADEASGKRWVEAALELSPKHPRAKLLSGQLDLRHDDPQRRARAAEELQAVAEFPAIATAEEALEDLKGYYCRIGDSENLWEVGRQESLLDLKKVKLFLEKKPTLLGRYSPVKNDGARSFADCIERCSHVEMQRSIRSVYIARKHLRHCLTTRYYVIAIEFRPFVKVTESARKKVMDKFAEDIRTNLESQNLSFSVIDHSTPAGLKVRWCGTNFA